MGGGGWGLKSDKDREGVRERARERDIVVFYSALYEMVVKGLVPMAIPSAGAGLPAWSWPGLEMLSRWIFVSCPFECWLKTWK